MSRRQSRRQVRARRRASRPTPWAFIALGVGLVLVGVALAFLLPKPEAFTASTDEPSAIPVTVDFPAPDLSVTDLEGGTLRLADFRGQVVLVNLWATWCPPCRAEMPTLEGYYRDHFRQGFVVLAIEAGGETQAQVREFVTRFDLSFPVGWDPEGRSLEVFRTQALPSSFVVDRQGQVRLAWTGAISRKMLDRYLTPLLESP